MKSNLRIYHKNDSAIILGAYMQYDSVQDRNFVVLWDGLDRCDIDYPFYTKSRETLILHSLRAYRQMILIKFSKSNDITIFGAKPLRVTPAGRRTGPRVILLNPMHQIFRYMFYPEHFYTDAETICLHCMYSYAVNIQGFDF